MNRLRSWLPLLGLVAFAACMHPRPVRRGAEARLRVMTYNIQAGHGNLAGTAAAIRASTPDVAALQEVDVHWAERSHFADQATELGARLHMRVRFASIYRLPAADSTKPPREFGVALLSRFPILSWRNDMLTRLSTQEPHPIPAPAPGLLEARLDVHGTPVRVFNTHLDYRADPRVRERQVAEMLGYIDATTTPTIMFGDMNATPGAPEIAPLLARLRDAWPSSETPGFTYPADHPTERIDYVLLSPHFRVRSATVPVTGASDHRSVVVELTMDGAGADR